MPPAPWSSDGSGATLDVWWRRLPGLLAACGGSTAIFEALHGGDPLADTFWLDRLLRISETRPGTAYVVLVTHTRGAARATPWPTSSGWTSD